MKSIGTTSGSKVRETRVERRERWKQAVSAHERSGQSVIAYCRSHGLKAWQFHSWRRRLTERRATAGGFKEIVGPKYFESIHARGDSAELRLDINGVVIHVPEQASVERLRVILAWVRSA